MDKNTKNWSKSSGNLASNRKHFHSFSNLEKKITGVIFTNKCQSQMKIQTQILYFILYLMLIIIGN